MVLLVIVSTASNTLWPHCYCWFLYPFIFNKAHLFTVKTEAALFPRMTLIKDTPYIFPYLICCKRHWFIILRFKGYTEIFLLGKIDNRFSDVKR